MNITIGVRSCSDRPLLDGFIKSYYSNLEQQYKPTLICCDGGTSKPEIVEHRRDLCKRWNVEFLDGKQPFGAYVAWQRIAEAIPETDLLAFFDEDDRFVCPGWLHRFIKFFEQNQARIVALPLLQEPYYRDDDERWKAPVKSLVSVSTAFALRPMDLHHVYEQSYECFVLPWPPVWSMKGSINLTSNDLPVQEIKWLNKLGQEESNGESPNEKLERKAIR